MQAYPFATLVTNKDCLLDANHLPFELDQTSGELGMLRAHVARGNPLFQSVENVQEVLIIFNGPHGYISPSWYPSKQEHHRQVPTWNYEVVHAHGTLQFVDDERFVRGIVARLTRQHEAQEQNPWRMTDAPPEFLSEMLAAIVGIEITITRLEGKRKLSQNKSIEDRWSAAAALIKRGNPSLASSMVDTIPKSTATR